MEDPFQVVKEEAQHSLNVVIELHKRWKELQKSVSGTDSEEYSWTLSELMSGLRSIEWDLQDLEETIGIVIGNRQKFGLSDEEINSRREFVDTTRASVSAIRREVTAAEEKEEKEKKRGVTSTMTSAKKAGTEREALLQNDSAKAESETKITVRWRGACQPWARS